MKTLQGIDLLDATVCRDLAASRQGRGSKICVKFAATFNAPFAANLLSCGKLATNVFDASLTRHGKFVANFLTRV
jgi:hypothetical protein